MSRDEIYANLCEAIHTVQALSGEKKTMINGETRPFDDLPGFDSLRSIEVIVLL